MKHLAKRIISIIPTILLAMTGFFLTKKYNFQFNIGLLIILVIGIFWGFAICFDAISEKNKEVESLKKEIEKIKSSYTVSPGKNIEGNNLLFMALTQHPAEPLKITMLEKATNEHNNIIAALILGNIYEYGVEYNGKILLKENKEEAFKIYNKIRENDNYGISDWNIGWFYQNNDVDEAKKLTEDERYIKAKEFYNFSENKGFPKAKNSLGNFIKNSKAGYNLNRNSELMIRYYSEANEQGDNYATLNCGHYYLRQFRLSKKIESLESARDFYEKAVQMKSPEGYVKLGIVNVEFYMQEKDIQYLRKAKENLTNSFSYGDNQFAATGYCILGTLIKQYPNVFKEGIIKKLPSDRFSDPIIECYVIAYEIFLRLISEGKTISDESNRYFEALSNAFQNANINFLNIPIDDYEV